MSIARDEHEKEKKENEKMCVVCVFRRRAEGEEQEAPESSASQRKGEGNGEREYFCEEWLRGYGAPLSRNRNGSHISQSSRPLLSLRL
jgi:hypothetical protein